MRVDETPAQAIARFRAERGHSQQELADLLCAAAGRPTVTRTEVARWERGTRRPGPYWRRWLNQVLGVPLASLRAASSPMPSGAGPAAAVGPARPVPTAVPTVALPVRVRSAAYRWLVGAAEPPVRPGIADPILIRRASMAVRASHRVGGIDLAGQLDQLWAATLADRAAPVAVLLEVARARVRALMDADRPVGAIEAAVAALDAAPWPSGPGAAPDQLAGAALIGDLAEAVLLLGEDRLAVELSRAALLGLPADSPGGVARGARRAQVDARAIRTTLTFQLCVATAQAGDDAAAEAALARAAALATERWVALDADGLAGWLAAGEAGRCWLALDQPVAAVRLLDEAIRAAPPAERDTAIRRYAGSLARGQLALGQTAAAEATVATGLVVAIRYGSVRLGRELSALPASGGRSRRRRAWPGLPVTSLRLTAPGSGGEATATRVSVAA